jgi:hypothetical protein
MVIESGRRVSLLLALRGIVDVRTGCVGVWGCCGGKLIGM